YESGDRRRFGEAPNVVTRESNRTPRTDERFFRCCEVRCSAGDWRQPWKRNGAGGQVASPSSHLKPEAIGYFFIAGFMYLDQHVLVALIRNRSARIDTRPVEHSEVV